MVNMPKRRKSKDNPYVLDYKEDINIYTVKFKDNKNVLQVVEVTEEVYKVFDKAELEDISQMHEYERHIEHSELTDITLNRRAKNKAIIVEEEVEHKIMVEEIKRAFDILTDTQKRRIKLYYFEGLNFKQIALREHCDESSVRESIYKGIEKIKKILN